MVVIDKMDVFLARQPIFDINNKVYGYEILYRESEKNFYSSNNGNSASSSVLISCFVDFGIEEVTNEKKAFINFTEELLFNDVATIFPPEYLVIEILENIPVTEELINRCKLLKEKGYMLALDDFVLQQGYDELINIVDIVKVDFMLTSESERAEIIKKYNRKDLQFLAEKVETYAEFKKAVKIGYTFFQGYYFARPEIDSRRKVIPLKESQLRLINFLNSESMDFNKLSQIIESDLAFSYEVLRLVNSARFYRKSKIASIRYALVTIGFNELKKWLYLAVIRDIKQEKPDELINFCMLRAKFLENIAMRAGKKELCSNMVTLGMFSMLDVLINKPMEEALSLMNFSSDIKDILVNKSSKGFMAESFQIVLKYEKGQWSEIKNICSNIGLSVSELNSAYMEAIEQIQRI